MRPSGSASRACALRFLRRLHAWIGLGGAAFGLLFGVTGFLLNHRAVMKVEAGQIQEQRLNVELAAPAPSPEALATQLAARFGFDPAQARFRIQAPRVGHWAGTPVKAAETWTITLGGHARFASATYLPGNRTVEVEQRNASPLAALKRLHTSGAGHLGWILLSDAFAGALLFLTLSGILLWTRLAGPKLLAAGLGFGGFVLLVGVASRAW